MDDQRDYAEEAANAAHMRDEHEITRATPDDAGCWVSSGTGWRGASEVIRIAWAYGMEMTEDDEKIVESFENGTAVVLSDGTKIGNGVNDSQNAADYILDQGGMSDNAVNWLNDNIAPDGFYFAWDDGEFFLVCGMTREEVEEEGYAPDSNGIACKRCNSHPDFHRGEND